MFSIDLRSRVPIYEQLVHSITEQVVKKVLLPDEPLPSVRNLARDLGINPNTVQRTGAARHHLPFGRKGQLCCAYRRAG